MKYQFQIILQGYKEQLITFFGGGGMERPGKGVMSWLGQGLHSLSAFVIY